MLTQALLGIYAATAAGSYVDISLTTDGRCIDFGYCVISLQSECDQAAADLGYAGMLCRRLHPNSQRTCPGAVHSLTTGLL